MNITPDEIVFFKIGAFAITGTLVYTWIVMALLLIISWLGTRRLKSDETFSRWQNFLEAIVGTIRNQIRDVTNQNPDPYVAFLGTLFLFISLSNLLAIVPFGYQPPTGSLYTTSALAICVFFAVPLYGVSRTGLRAYLKHYVQPSPIVLPFNIIGEFSRTLALAVRLFGNMMSGTLIIGVLVSLAPLFLPIPMHLLGLLIGQIQAYIFAVLATVYIASATKAYQERDESDSSTKGEHAHG